MHAHAFGQRYELPIPLALFVLGGAAVVVASFLLVLSRRVPSATSRPADMDGDNGRSGLRPVSAVLSVAVLVFLLWCGWTGSQEVGDNLLPTFFWLVVWIAVPLSCGLLGDWTGPVNPFRVVSRLTDRPGWRRVVLGGEDPVGWPAGVGWWPSVLLYVALAFGELVFTATATTPRNIAGALLLYLLLCAAAGLIFGPRWLAYGEIFTVLFATWGRLGCFRFGAPGRRGFAGGLLTPFRATPSRMVFVVLLLVSVNFDGLLATPWWSHQERARVGLVAQDSWRLESLRIAGFVVLALAIGVVFAGFAVAAARVGRRRRRVTEALTVLLPSLLPIAFGYLLAHNTQYLVVNAQTLPTLFGNPTGLGSWPIHLPYPFDGGFEPRLDVLPSAAYWYVAVVVIVAVHVVAVVLAHRELGQRRSSHERPRAAELPWLVAMVGYTMLSLWLLAQPLVQEGSSPPASAAVSGVVGVTRS
jgi:hypothetical protein